VDGSDPYAGPGRRGGGKPQATSSYRSALDALFDGEKLPEKFKTLRGPTKLAGDRTAKGNQLTKGGAKRQKLLKALRETMDRDEVESGIKELLEMDGELPEDADVLTNVLRHSDEEIVLDAINKLSDIHDARPIKRREVLRQRLRQVEELAEEPDTQAAAAKLRGRL